MRFKTLVLGILACALATAFDGAEYDQFLTYQPNATYASAYISTEQRLFGLFAHCDLQDHGGLETCGDYVPYWAVCWLRDTNTNETENRGVNYAFTYGS